MLLRDMMKRIGFLFAGLVLIFSLMAIDARAQSTRQTIAFSVLAEYETETNDVPSDPTLTDQYFHLLLITGANVVKAIAVDQFGKPNWTNWSAATIVRRVNLTTGDERIYLNNGGTNEVDVSSYFSGSYVSNFTSGVSNAFPAATNNFDTNNPNPLQPLFSGTPTIHRASAGLFFISLTTTNLKMNLVGSSIGGLGTGLGVLTKFSGNEKGTNYSGEVENEVISVVGSFSWTMNTNLFDISPGTNTFYSGPAHGTVTVREPTYSPLALPSPNPE
jgi:hypothetical protein